MVVVIAVGVAVSYGVRLAEIGAAYKAKMLCSDVFVAGREIDAVLADLVVDDLSALKLISVSIDTHAKTTTANLFGLAESNVRYREAFGCALSDGDAMPASFKLKTTKAANTQLLETSKAVNPNLKVVLDEAFSEPDPEHLRRTRAVVILHKGRVVAEQYAADIGPDSPMPGWSMTKSVMNALAGIMVKEGRLTTHTAALAGTGLAPDDPRNQITIEHLLHMSSGLAFNENIADPLSDVSRMILTEPDMAAFAANMPLQAEPGTHWQYSTGTTNILAAVLRRVLGESAYYEFPGTALFQPLGMTRALLETDASGTFAGSSFMYATAREWARFGLLYLQDGVWEGERILPEGWVQFSRTPAPADHNATYGAHFWLNVQEAFAGAGISLPEDAFHAVGHEGQFITIIPSRETVIVRLGKTRYSQAWKHDVFVSKVLVALDTVH